MTDGKYKGTSKSNKKYSGYDENHEGDVHGVLDEGAEGEEKAGRHAAFLQRTADADPRGAAAFSGDTASVLRQPHRG